MNESSISIVIPAYRCASSLTELFRRLEATLEALAIDYEIILVDDRSPDDDWNVIKTLAAQSPRVVGLQLSRNFGQHPAIMAGLSASKGEWIVVMDGDLQDNPLEIPKLLEVARGGYEVVQARRVARRDSWFRRSVSGAFYRILSSLTDSDYDAAIANFGVYHRKVIDAVLSFGEQFRYFPTMVRWVGFRRTTVVVEHLSRYEGRSAYSISRMMSLASKILVSNSNKPLRFVMLLGLILAVGAALVGLTLIVLALCGKFTVLGWPSVIVSIWLLSGVIIFILGIIGLYLGQVFDEVKGRPVFIVGERIGAQ